MGDSPVTVDRLEQVMALDGAEFLGQAYLLVLGRPIDPEGFQNYEAQLRAGASKLAILSALAASQEGQARDADTTLLRLLPKTRFACGTGRTPESADFRGVIANSPVAESIQALLTLDDVAFINGAYRTLLRRAPDPTGFSQYLQLIRAGACKMRIVCRLRLSTEGRKAASPLPGLRRAICHYWLANNVLTGWWYRPLAQAEGETPLECRLRAVENTLMRMAQEQQMDAVDFDNAADDVARLLKALAARRSA
jgi:hypothetical protein